MHALAALVPLALSLAQDPQSRLTTPADPLAHVRSAFQAAHGKARFLAVLSPT